MKIGDTIYLRKFYSGYQEYEIVGETSRSWLVRKPKALLWSADQKIPKTLKGYIQGTQHDQKLLEWAFARGFLCHKRHQSKYARPSRPQYRRSMNEV